MEPENSFRRLMPRKDELQASRFTEAGTLPAAHSPTFSHVPSLWDYWPIVLRHKWTILSAMLVALLVGAVVSFSTTPIYEAIGRVVINREGAETAGLKNSDTGGSDSYDDYMVAMDTQTHVLQSDAIAKLVIRRLNLDSDPAFAGKGAVSASSTPDALPAQTRYIEPHRESGLVGKFHGSLQINSIPRTRLLEIRFSSSDPSLAAKAVNTLIDTYIEADEPRKISPFDYMPLLELIVNTGIADAAYRRIWPPRWRCIAAWYLPGFDRFSASACAI